MGEKLQRLLNSEITLSEFLLNDERDLELDDLIIDAEHDNIHIDFGSDDESIDINEIKLTKVDPKDEKDLTSSVINLKKDWTSLLNDEKYIDDLDAFMTKYHLTMINIDFQEEEVKFISGKYQLVEGLDLYNQ